MVLLALSGAAVLSYEIVWARDFALVYGSTATGAAVVVAAVFAGLSLGAAFGARWSTRATGLRLYAALEATLAGAGVAYLLVRPLLAAGAIAIATALPPSFTWAARTGLAFAVLLVPATLAGATLPAAVAAIDDAGTADVARVYAWNTFGGAVGALLTGFLLIRLVGMRATIVTAAAMEIAVAASAYRLSRGAVRGARSDSGRPSSAVPEVLAIAGMTGCLGLAAEVLWTRGLAGVLSSSVYSVTLVLAGVLLGVVAGAAMTTRLVARRTHFRAQLSLVATLLAASILGSYWMLRALPAVSLAAIETLGVAGPGTGLGIEAVLALLVVLVPSMLSGALLPLTVAIAGDQQTVWTLGRVLAANTAGGIVGSLGAALVLLPRWGLGVGLLTLAALAAAMAAALTPTWRARGFVALVVLATVGTGLGEPLRLPWRSPPGERVLWYRDGATATVAVTEEPSGARRLRVNGQYSLGGTDSVLLERREAHLPLLLHAAPRRVLHLGVGTGDTVGAELAHPDVTVDGVELVAETLDATAFFSAENDDLLSHPRARLVADDARSFLLTTPRAYDVVVSDLFLPWTAGTASLYSLDFYRLARTHLAPGGIYCQWLPLHQLAVDDLGTIVATFCAAFPHVELWVAYHRTATPLAALLGSDAPIRTDVGAMRARLADPALARSLASVGLDDPGDLAALYVTDGEHLRAATASVAPMTDDDPTLEFTAPAAYFHQAGLARRALAWVAERLDPGPAPIAGAPPLRGDVRGALLAAQLALLDGDGPGELRAYLRALTMTPDVRAIRQALVAIRRDRLRVGDDGTADVIGEALRHFAPASREATVADGE